MMSLLKKILIIVREKIDYLGSQWISLKSAALSMGLSSPKSTVGIYEMYDKLSLGSPHRSTEPLA